MKTARKRLNERTTIENTLENEINANPLAPSVSLPNLRNLSYSETKSKKINKCIFQGVRHNKVSVNSKSANKNQDNSGSSSNFGPKGMNRC